jgi:site-specific recombinase XerD
MSSQPLVRFREYLRASDRSENTVEAYLRDLRLFGEWFQSSSGEHMTPQAITPIDVKEYKAYLLQVKGFKPATVNRRLASISAFCK